MRRFEKGLLILLAGLGAGYWGFGLLLVLMVPGDFSNPAYRYKVPLLIINRLMGTGLFAIFELAVIKNRIRSSRMGWLIFSAVLAGEVLGAYLIEGLLMYQ